MTRIPTLTALLLLAAAFFGQATAEDRETMRRTYVRSAPAEAGQSLRLEAHNADITVTGSGGDSVAVEAVIEITGADSAVVEEYFQAASLVLERDGGGIYARLHIPEPQVDNEGRSAVGFLRRMFYDEGGNLRLSTSTRLRVRVPSRFSVDLFNRYGDVRVEGLDGELSLDNSSGGVEIRDAGGSLSVANDYGEVEVSRFRGPVDVSGNSTGVTLSEVDGRANVRTSYKGVRLEGMRGQVTVHSLSGEVTGRGIEGDCTVRNSYKRVELEEVSGSLKVVSQSGSVRLDGVGGNVEIESSYKSIRVSRVGGSLAITGNSSEVEVNRVEGDAAIVSSYKPIRVEDVTGSLTINGTSSEVTVESVDRDAVILTSYKPVRVEDVAGSLTVNGNSSRVTVESVEGDVTVANSYKPVVIKGASGSITVRGNHSPIEVSRMARLKQGGRIVLATSGKPVTLALPAGAEPGGSLRTRHGRIVSDFPVTATADQRSARLKAGGGSFRISVDAGRDITLRRE